MKRPAQDILDRKWLSNLAMDRGGLPPRPVLQLRLIFSLVLLILAILLFVLLEPNPDSGTLRHVLVGAALGLLGMSLWLAHLNFFRGLTQEMPVEAVLRELGLSVTQEFELQDILRITMDGLVDRLGMFTARFYLWDETLGCYTPSGVRSVSTDTDALARLRETRPELVEQVAASGKELLIPNMAGDPLLDGAGEAGRGACLLLLPLLSRNHTVGVLELTAPAERPVSPLEVELLRSLAQKIGIAIENARLYRQLRYMAVLEERNHLAREMHDHLSQSLGYINVRAAMADELLAAGQVKEGRENLLELKRAAKILYTDVRESIFNLRKAGAPHPGLLSTLEDYLADYRAYYGLDARLLGEGEGEIELSAEAIGQILRIVQESLSNVRKHACADRVLIRCEQRGDRVWVSVEDNGLGFDPGEVTEEGQKSFGLLIMSERAESVGGQLEIESQPGRGTRVVVQVPVR